jgi:hypothetical protein
MNRISYANSLKLLYCITALFHGLLRSDVSKSLSENVGNQMPRSSKPISLDVGVESLSTFGCFLTISANDVDSVSALVECEQPLPVSGGFILIQRISFLNLDRELYENIR